MICGGKISIPTHTHMHNHTHMHMYIHTFVCLYAIAMQTYPQEHLHMCMCMYTCTDVRRYTYMHTRACTPTSTCTCTLKEADKGSQRMSPCMQCGVGKEPRHSQTSQKGPQPVNGPADLQTIPGDICQALLGACVGRGLLFIQSTPTLTLLPLSPSHNKIICPRPPDYSKIDSTYHQRRTIGTCFKGHGVVYPQ